MKNFNQSLQNKLSKYSNWLDSKYFYQIGDEFIKFKSGAAYVNYMLKGFADLHMNPHSFIFQLKPELINKLEIKLKSSKYFKKRDSKVQSDILSAFSAYKKYNLSK